MADTTAVPVEMDLVALLVEVLVLITIVHLDHLLKKKEAGGVILETTHLMEDTMIGTTTMDHLETALAMADLTDPVVEAGVVILETTPLEARIEDLDRTIPEVDQCFPNLGAALIILATMDLVT